MLGEMFPGRKLGRVARDEDSDGDGDGPRLADGSLDLDSGVVRFASPRRDNDRADEDEPG